MENRVGIIDVGGILVSGDIIYERFCCDLEKCKGQCCVEGDAGAPVTLDEIAAIEDALDVVWGDLSASAQAVIDKQGVAYTDQEGDLVTSIVRGKDCVFTCHEDLCLDDGTVVSGCCLCLLEKAYRAGKSPVYRFLREPLIKRFGEEWYNELVEVAKQLESMP